MTSNSPRHTDSWNILPVVRQTSGSPSVKYMVGRIFLLLVSKHLHSNFATMTNPMTYRIAIDPIVARDYAIVLVDPIGVLVLVVNRVPLPMTEMKVHSPSLARSSPSAAVME